MTDDTLPDLPAFASEGDAIAWMIEAVDDPCVDNERIAYDDDPTSVAAYEEAERTGCCGSFDAPCTIAGRAARIGCNYGH